MFSSEQKIDITNNLKKISHNTENNIEFNNHQIVLPLYVIECDLPGFNILQNVWINLRNILVRQLIENTFTTCKERNVFCFFW